MVESDRDSIMNLGSHGRRVPVGHVGSDMADERESANRGQILWNKHAHGASQE